MSFHTCHYNYKTHQIVHLKLQDMNLEIVSLGTAKDMNVPMYFVRPMGGHGALWGLYEHEIEAHD